jgi:hypothetical protein
MSREIAQPDSLPNESTKLNVAKGHITPSPSPVRCNVALVGCPILRLQCAWPPNAWSSRRSLPYSSPKGPVQKSTKAYACLGEALCDSREMRVYIGLVHGDHLLRLVEVQGFVIRLVPAAGLGLHAIPDGLNRGDHERLVGPLLGIRAGPCGALCIRHARADLGGDLSDVFPELALDDIGIPHGMEVPCAWPLFMDGGAVSVVLERHMERLVGISHPMAEVFQRREPVHPRSTDLREDRKIRIDRRYHAFVIQGIRVVPHLCGRVRQVDEVLAGALARVVKPREGLREQLEVGITLEELDHPCTRLRIELLERDLTNDLMLGVTPGIHVVGTDETEEDHNAGSHSSTTEYHRISADEPGHPRPSGAASWCSEAMSWTFYHERPEDPIRSLRATPSRSAQGSSEPCR